MLNRNVLRTAFRGVPHSADDLGSRQSPRAQGIEKPIVAVRVGLAKQNRVVYVAEELGIVIRKEIPQPISILGHPRGRGPGTTR